MDKLLIFSNMVSVSDTKLLIVVLGFFASCNDLKHKKNI